MRITDFFAKDAATVWSLEDGLSQQGLLAQASAVAAALAAHPHAAAGTAGLQVALACRSMVSFVPGLLGAWAAGATVHLLPNVQPGTLARAYQQCALFLHDVVEARDFSPADIYLPAVITDAGRAAPAPDLCDQARVVFSTSGTTGTPGLSTKMTAQLWQEANVLQALMGDGRVLLSTVPAHHLYGLLFGILTPLRRGMAVVQRQAFLPAEVAAIMHDANVDVLISTPAHMAAMRHVDMPRDRRVFSSGALLPMDVHVALASAFRWRVTDVLGSTETGGIATRGAPLARWRPLPGVTLRANADDEMTVASPWCDGGQHVLADRLALAPDGSFLHLGRRDHVVKIGGKRLDVPALEALLQRLPGVADAAVYYDAQSQMEGRLRYALAGVPQDRAVITAAVCREFDPVFAPRQVVWVERLPRDAMGKLPRMALAGLFGAAKSERVRTVPMRIDGATVVCEVPRHLLYFEGHFPALPVLPGAAVLQCIAVPALRLLAPALGEVRALRRIRFMQPVFPGQQISVEATQQGNRMTFTASSVGNQVASGVVDFADLDGGARGAIV